jgi:hypothetical protein
MEGTEWKIRVPENRAAASRFDPQVGDESRLYFRPGQPFSFVRKPEQLIFQRQSAERSQVPAASFFVGGIFACLGLAVAHRKTGTLGPCSIQSGKGFREKSECLIRHHGKKRYGNPPIVFVRANFGRGIEAIVGMSQRPKRGSSRTEGTRF